MTQAVDRYARDFERSRPTKLREVRKAAFARFAESGFPTTENEDWKYTSVAAIAETPFAMAEPRKITLKDFEHVAFPDSPFCRLVFVNGLFARELSFAGKRSDGIEVGSLAAAPLEKLEPHLTTLVDGKAGAFASLNTAFFADGAFVFVPRGVASDIPVHLLFVSTPGVEPAVSYPRILIVADRDSKAIVIEDYLALGDAPYFTDAVTEVVLDENASIEHCKLQRENEAAFHVATIRAHQARSSRFVSHSVSVGGALARNDIHAVLDAEGAECHLNGLYRVAGRQHVDHHTTIDHARPHGSSRELYKGILAGKARAVFNGKIVVRQDAQKTDALQTNKNLLLSDDALVHTKPQLEIFANDVKCKHGATVGQIDRDMLFYLRSRGIELETARRLLIFAFASEMVAQIGNSAVRAGFSDLLFPEGVS